MEVSMHPQRLLTLLLTAFVLLPAAQSSAGTLQQVLTRNELRVGVTLAAPWAIRDDEGEFSGFEVDVARQLAADMDVSVEFLRYDYNALIRALEANEIDLIAAGLTITPERALHVNFSRPYATGGIGMATNLATTADIERLEQLNSPEFTVAVMADSAAEDLAARVLPQARRQAYRSEDEASEALVAGDVDVYLEQEPIPSFLAVEYPRNVDVPVNRPLLETRSAFAVTKGDPDFVFFLNAWIEAREADTWLPTRYQYWFKTLQWRD
jgi:polar amino acid transport system substrate-binding protein